MKLPVLDHELEMTAKLGILGIVMSSLEAAVSRGLNMDQCTEMQQWDLMALDELLATELLLLVHVTLS